MAGKNVYPKGVMGFMRNDRAPEFVIGALTITPNDLVAWLKSEGAEYMSEYNGKKQIRLQLLKGNEGKINVVVDTYKPVAKNNAPAQDQAASPGKHDDDLPF